MEKNKERNELIFVGIGIVIVALWFLFKDRNTETVTDETLSALTDAERKAIAEKIKKKSWFATLIRVAADYNIPRQRIAAIVATESRGNERAEGKAGEKGLMQLMPGAVEDVYEHWGKSYTIATLTGLNLFDAKENLLIGTAYLALVKERFNGNLNLATKRYNGVSEPQVSKYLNEVLSFEKFF